MAEKRINQPTFFTDFFESNSPFNDDPAKEYKKFMNNNEMDFENGSIRKISRGNRG